MIGVIAIAYEDIQRRIRRRKIRFRVLLAIFFISIIGVVLFRYPILKVRNIIVKGNSIVQADKIIEMSKIKSGDNILRINMKESKKGIASDPYIEASYIKMNILGDITISVVERQCAGVVKYGSKYVTIDTKGVIIEMPDKIEGRNLPLIEGLDIKKAAIGQTAEVSDIRKLNTLKILFDNIKEQGLSDIINGVDENNLELITLKTKYGINFKLGDIENLSDKLSKCNAIVEQDLKKKGLKGTIDVSFNGNPVFKPE